ncbi:hypothetical protein CHS0354_034799 [Potamilus streckersoni]|uniref:Dehydrogenase/reductase SDR family member 4 n=1 Tax=Potamilus streckersoni TaxID=2493646 RepID=A0AAE0VJD1_9BIVA|nr:hypothetical protein CHS0354_034799 [Potamilus streckersoni]
MGKLSGKVAIVTASTDGIGLAIARRLAEDGAAVMVSSRKQQNVDSAVKELRNKNLSVSGIVCHVGIKEDRERMIQKTLKEYGGIDILVSNAAVNPVFGPILDTTESAWDKIMDINLKSSFFLCKEVVPHMEARGGGSVVFVSSIGGYNISEFMGPYGMSKTALLGLTKALVPQLAQKRIRVNCIAPGLVKTKFSEQLWKDSGAASSAYAQIIPMKRFAEPEDCAGIVSFLVSDDASYITGETVVIGGGVSARL